MKKFIVLFLILGVVLSAPLFAGGSREDAPDPSEQNGESAPTASTDLLADDLVIEENKIVQIHYEGTLADGSVFDSSEGREPLEFIYGVGMVIPGLEDGLRGMSVGERANIEVAYADAYGPYRDEGRVEYPRDQIDPSIPLEEGMMLQGQGPQGPIPVTVLEVHEETVLLDFNHPFAGQDLFFEVDIISIREATEEELEMIFGGGFSQPQ
ncbi:MAG: peptidylprolyl isomerase [Spirochaetaceae bacterium]|nr:MAG: peptidylprolyl isomerase [Spirochaetaceae bacterium]